MEHANVVPAVVPSQDYIHLELHVRDSSVMKYLLAFEESQREEKALEAIRVGVVAIQSAIPSLDTKIVEVTHLSLYDGSVEGLRHRSLPVFSVQYHPEASPGPHDSHYFFNRFIETLDEFDRTPRLVEDA